MRPPKPVTIDGVSYPSMRAAARALGVSAQAISQRANPEQTNRRKRAYNAARRPIRLSLAKVDALAALPYLELARQQCFSEDAQRGLDQLIAAIEAGSVVAPLR
jgi:hypothetical protein